MIRPYLSEGECKIKLIMSIKFMSSQNSEETRTTHTKSHNLEIIIDNETDHIINDLFLWSAFAKLSKRFRNINESK